MKTSANSTAPVCTQAYRDNAEPAMDELMSDPIVRQLMRSDNVSVELLGQLHTHIEALRQRYAASAQLQ